MVNFNNWMSVTLWFVLVGPGNLEAGEFRKASYKEFDEMFSILKKTEIELMEAHTTHAGHALANQSRMTSENSQKWARFSATWNQNLNANKDMDALRIKYNKEGLFDCPGELNLRGPSDTIKCGLDHYKSQLFTLWSLMNKQLSGRIPASKKELELVDGEIKDVKKRVQAGLLELKKTRS